MGVQSVDRAIFLIDALAQRPKARLSELSQLAGLNKATTFQLLASLRAAGLVCQDKETRQYQLGYKVLEWSALLEERIQLVRLARSEMRRLRDLSGETVAVGVLEDLARIPLARIPSPQALKSHVPIGRRQPLYCGAAGKVLLSYLPEPDRQRYVEGLRAAGVSLERVQNELTAIRQQGYATVAGEPVKGLRSVAVPLFDWPRRPVGYLGIIGPEQRLTSRRAEVLAAELIESSKRLSSRLHEPPPAAGGGLSL